MRIFAALCCAILFSAISAFSQVAATPPMGWNSWNHFAERVTDADVRSAADALVSTGMRDAGYVYVNVDDTWQGKRDAQGVLHPNERFPDMKALGDYIHSKGLKFGIYSSPGAQTCGHYEGSLGHEVQDAKMYAEWGVDFLKYDLCSFQENMQKVRAEHPDDPNAAKNLMIAAYRKMGDALKATGRPIVYSLCQYGVDQPWKWGPELGANMWRTTDDIDDSYGRMIAIGFSQAGLSKYAGPGHWNDPDMLEIGNGKLTPSEDRAHFSMWAMIAAPLIAGNDLRNMNQETKAVLNNKNVIAVNQDVLGIQGFKYAVRDSVEIWFKPLNQGKWAVAFLNRSKNVKKINFDWKAETVKDEIFKKDLNSQQQVYKLKNLWTNKASGTTKSSLTAKLPAHDILMMQLEK